MGQIALEAPLQKAGTGMHTLANDMLTVSILDPVADQEKLGTRYCSGGYVFEVKDGRHGSLMSGPTYPDEYTAFNGQGIPDAFNLSPLFETPPAGGQALVIGVGVCDLARDAVVEHCAWEVAQTAGGITMRTAQAFQGFGLRLERTVALRGRTLRSATRLLNSGQRPIPVRWFPHPFYPLPQGEEALCRFNVRVDVPENPAYRLAKNGWLARKPIAGEPRPGGYYQALDHQATSNLVVLQKHPALGLAAATCSYVPGLLPVWGNTRTFSWEPFFERTVAAGQEAAWWIDYEF
jgi:hypothetical protein